MNSALIVEDDPARRRGLAVQLGRHGWQVHVTNTLAATLALLDQPPVQVVYINEMINDDAGYRLLGAIRKHPHWSHVRVVMAGLGDVARQAACALELGADGFASLHWPQSQTIALLTRLPDESISIERGRLRQSCSCSVRSPALPATPHKN